MAEHRIHHWLEQIFLEALHRPGNRHRGLQNLPLVITGVVQVFCCHPAIQVQSVVLPRCPSLRLCHFDLQIDVRLETILDFLDEQGNSSKLLEERKDNPE